MRLKNTFGKNNGDVSTEEDEVQRLVRRLGATSQSDDYDSSVISAVAEVAHIDPIKVEIELQRMRYEERIQAMEQEMAQLRNQSSHVYYEKSNQDFALQILSYLRVPFILIAIGLMILIMGRA